MTEQDERYTQALEALEAGDLKEAERLLSLVVKDDRENADAWYHLATTQSEDERKRQCLQFALDADPDHALAKEAMDELVPPEPEPEPVPEPISEAEPEPEVIIEDVTETQDDEPGTDNGRPKNEIPFPNAKTATPKIEDENDRTLFSIPAGIPGAPEKMTTQYLVDFYRGLFENSVSIFTGQSATIDTGIASWWRILLMAITVGLIHGVVLLLAIMLINMRSLSIFSFVTLPVFQVITACIALGAGVFLSHWYITTQHQGKASLLNHAYVLTVIWLPASILNASLMILQPFIPGYVITVPMWISGNVSFQGATILYTLASAGILAYAGYLMHTQLQRLYRTADERILWFTIAIMLFPIALVF